MFENPDIDLEDVPRMSEVHWRKVSKRLVTRNTIRNALTVSLFVLLFIGLLVLRWIPMNVVFANPIGISTFVLVLLFFIVFGVWPSFEVPRRGFVVREHDFLYTQGILFSRTFSIPFARIQHVETTVSIFDRMVNLGALRLYTAGAANVFLGFEKDYAHTLRVHILDRVRDLDQEMLDEDGLVPQEDT